MFNNVDIEEELYAERIKKLLFEIINPHLRLIFRTRFHNKFGTEWQANSFTHNDSLMMVQYTGKPVKKFRDTIANAKHELKMYDSGDVDKWDCNLLVKLLVNVFLGPQYTVENDHIKALRQPRNQGYGHLPNNLLQESEFLSLWRQAETALIALGVPPDEIDIIRNFDKPIMFNVRDPIRTFSGRTEFLETLHMTLTRDDLLGQPCQSSQPQRKLKIVTGIGGVGKTEVVRKYISLHCKILYRNVVWLDAESDLSLQASFIRLAQDLNLPSNRLFVPNKKMDPIQVKAFVESVFRKICRTTSLVVFDTSDRINGSGPAADWIKEFLSCTISSDETMPHVLIISENRAWGPYNDDMLPLACFSETESLEFLTKHFPDIKHSLLDAKRLHVVLDGLPLALQQAVAYIRAEVDVGNYFPQSATTESMLQSYLKKFQVASKRRERLRTLPFDSPKDETIYTMWSMVLATLNTHGGDGKMAILLVELIAFLRAEKIPLKLLMALNIERWGVWEKMITYYKIIRNDPRIIKDMDSAVRGIQLLEKYCIITKHPGLGSVGTSIVTHRLVQDAVMESLEARGALFSTSKAVSKSRFPIYYAAVLEDEDCYDSILPNIISLIEYSGPKSQDEFRSTNPTRKYGQWVFAATKFILDQWHNVGLHTLLKFGPRLTFTLYFLTTFLVWYYKSDALSHQILFFGMLLPLGLTLFFNSSEVMIIQCRVYLLQEFFKAYKRRNIPERDHRQRLNFLYETYRLRYIRGCYPMILKAHEGLCNKLPWLGNLLFGQKLSLEMTKLAAKIYLETDNPKMALKTYQQLQVDLRIIIRTLSSGQVKDGELVLVESLMIQRGLAMAKLGLEGCSKDDIERNLRSIYVGLINHFAADGEMEAAETHPEVLETLRCIGVVFYKKRDYAQAARFLLCALRLQMTRLGLAHPSTQRTGFDLGVVLASQRKYREALQLHQGCLYIRAVCYLDLQHPLVRESEAAVAGVQRCMRS